MTFSYETIGNSSYLVATFAEGEGLINYQLQMLSNNEIKNIIKANKRQKNDDVLVSYNITSKIALAQMDIKNKIPKLGLIKIIEGALSALEELEEYQLVSSGILFDEKYVFVKPGSYEPSFIYVPNSLEDSGIKPLKEFLMALIMGSKVERSNDNFFQVLVDTLNDPALTTKELKKMCDKYKSVEPKSEDIKPEKIPSVAPQSIPQPESVVPENRVYPKLTPPVEYIPPVVPKEAPAEKKLKTAEDDKKNPKTKFILFQIVFACLLAAIVLSGSLNDAGGDIDLKYLAAVVVGIAAVDFVIYREMFVNNKAAKDTKKQSADKTKKVPAVPSKEGKPRIEVPAKEKDIPVAPVRPVVPEQPPVPSVRKTEEKSSVAVAPENDIENSDTDVLMNDDGAYLELFENGLATKIRLDKESTIVGKLSSQCDFAINNSKVSKMHAEFIARGGAYFVKDYNSTNGTYINGSIQRIQSNMEYPINNGDRITLANVDLIFRC